MIGPAPSSEDDRRRLWGALSTSRRAELLDEWERAHPGRPGDDPGSRARARLAWCVAAMGRPPGDGS